MSYRKKSNGRSETPQGPSLSGKPTMSSMPFLRQLDSNLADIVRDVITGTLSEEDKDNFLMKILSEKAWDGYQKWKFGNKEPDVSKFLNELSNYCRKTCENYIELGKLDMLEQVLIIKNVSPEAMKTFYTWKRMQSVRVEAETSSEEKDPQEDMKSDCEENDFRNEFSQKLPSTMNILVLGETGVGKSTFINVMVNYLKYHSIAEALQEGVEILIPSQFFLYDKDFKNRNFINKPTIPDEQGSAQNENAVTGKSTTQDPKSYVFQWSDEKGPKAIRIIDTPGIGDTREVDQDKKNLDKILSYISDYSELHAVCILMKPNTVHLTLAFRFCIDKLLVHLHKSVSQNILFCFTNTRCSLYQPGDALLVLREYLESLQAKQGIHIPTDRSSLFSFDNESFRFLCACKEGWPFSDTEKEILDTSWTRSVEETLRLFSRISDLRPHSVSDTLCLNNTRSAILTLSRPLAAIAKNQLINMKLIEDKMQEVEAHAKAGLDLRGKLHVDQVMLRTEEIDFPQTVCTAGKCVEHRRFNNDENALMQTIHKTICHDHCYLQGVKAETVPNPALQQCYAMHGNGSNCRVCGCQWELHMHIRYKLHEYMEKVVDPTVQASIANKENTVRTIEKFLEAERKKVDKLRMESEKITAYCAEFAAFLAKNSILPYNDSYRLYIEQLIKEEKEKIAEGGSTELLQKMENYKAEYEQQVSLLDKNMNNPSAEPRSVTDINRMVTELKQLENCGSILTEIQKLELLKGRETQQHMGKTVSLRADNSWLAAPKKMLKKGKKWITGY